MDEHTKATSDELVEINRNGFDMRLGFGVKELDLALDLALPISLQTAKNGHFRTIQAFKWKGPKTLKF
ncbi:hypothetical protein F5883DRAFT_642871 [Diaporthe sp. PMI_573]|nr:hypothetical protein F5883DRAFT_642871 [Diaporthaceae sp. PMI_573]